MTDQLPQPFLAKALLLLQGRLVHTSVDGLSGRRLVRTATELSLALFKDRQSGSGAPSCMSGAAQGPPVRLCERGCGRLCGAGSQACCTHCPRAHTRTCRHRERSWKEQVAQTTAVGPASASRRGQGNSAPAGPPAVGARATPSEPPAAAATSGDTGCQRPACRDWRREAEALREEVTALHRQLAARDQVIESLLAGAEQARTATGSASPPLQSWTLADEAQAEPEEEAGPQ